MSLIRLFLFNVLLLGMPFSGLAGYNYIHFEDSEVNLSEESFRRFIRPQARFIIQDFYFLLKKSHPLYGELIDLRNKVLKLSLDWRDWQKECHEVTLECVPVLKDLYQSARRVDQETLRLAGKKFTQDSLESSLGGSWNITKDLDSLHLLTYKLTHMFEELIITVNTPYQQNTQRFARFSPMLHEIKLISERVLIDLMPDPFKTSYDLVWVNYIEPIERHVVIDQNKEQLIKKLGDFNVAWNSFHMKMAKSDLEVNQQLVKVIGIMHNRWNSILKVILIKK